MSGPAVPFAVRFGVVPQIVEAAKHERQPTKFKATSPTQQSGDGKAVPPTPDDPMIEHHD